MLRIVLQVTESGTGPTAFSQFHIIHPSVSANPHHRPHYLPHPSHGFIIYQLRTCAVAVVSPGVSVTFIVFTEDGCVFLPLYWNRAYNFTYKQVALFLLLFYIVIYVSISINVLLFYVGHIVPPLLSHSVLFSLLHVFSINSMQRGTTLRRSA